MMETINRAIEGAAAFKDMMHKVQRTDSAARAEVSAEVREWNAQVEARKLEKLQRKLARQAGK
jgi:hypothetical protein